MQRSRLLIILSKLKFPGHSSSIFHNSKNRFLGVTSLFQRLCRRTRKTQLSVLKCQYNLGDHVKSYNVCNSSPFTRCRIGFNPIRLYRIGLNPSRLGRIGSNPSRLGRIGPNPYRLGRIGSNPSRLNRIGLNPSRLGRIGLNPSKLGRIGPNPSSPRRIG